MPYIKSEDRSKLSEIATEAVNEINRLADESDKPNVAGNINFLMSTIVGQIANQNISYATLNELIGALECIKLEFYRRKVSNYEDKKIGDNGDIVEFM